jgi:deferrochelatase/peroxidase EfeB
MAEPWPFEAHEAGVQQLAVYGCATQHSRHGMLRVVDAQATRRWLQALLGHGWLTVAKVGHHLPRDEDGKLPPTHCALNIGVSNRGLQALDLAPALLAVLRAKAPAFTQGAVLRAARKLGDTGNSAPAFWEPGFGHDESHLLVSLHADHLSALHERWDALAGLPGAQGLVGWQQAVSDGHHLVRSGKRVVHFGYRDGFTNPRIEGLHGNARHAPGELLLGYPNDDRANAWALGDQPEAAAFFRHATFGVFRKMAQDEAGFQGWVAQTAAAQQQTPEWVMGKLCGRTPDGELMLPPGATAPATSHPANKLQDWDYAHDPKGEGCPFGSHVRRMNPRSDALVQRRKRPLMRRGMPYGPAFDHRAGHDAQARGLLGLFFCASLEDQFEHLLGEWANKNPMGPDNRGTAKDPLIGQHDDPSAALAVPGHAGGSLGWLQPFVTTRGTAYLLYLAEPALRLLAAG